MTQGAIMQAQHWANMRERYERNIEPRFCCSRCKLGKNRVFYVVWRYGEYFTEDRKPLAFGYTVTIEEAEARMAEITGPCPEIEIIRCAQAALFYHREFAEHKRQRRPPSREQSSAVVEFVYDAYQSDEDWEWHALPHRIIRRTRKRVFVNINPYYSDREIWNGRTYALNRAELEQTGSVYVGRGTGTHRLWASMEAFYRDHPPRGARGGSPDCLAFFGLKLPTNVDSLRAVYRDRIKRAHPDHGGDPEHFRQVQLHYEAALTFLEEKHQ